MKLVIEEPESAALEAHLNDDVVIATSEIAVVEIGRAARVANPSDEVGLEVDLLLDSCLLVAITSELLRSARNLSSAAIRTLDAIHLASAIRIGADELLAYDQRLLNAARERGLTVVTPGTAA